MALPAPKPSFAGGEGEGQRHQGGGGGKGSVPGPSVGAKRPGTLRRPRQTGLCEQTNEVGNVGVRGP
jgi:hypothetical protein